MWLFCRLIWGKDKREHTILITISSNSTVSHSATADSIQHKALVAVAVVIVLYTYQQLNKRRKFNKTKQTISFLSEFRRTFYVYSILNDSTFIIKCILKTASAISSISNNIMKHRAQIQKHIFHSGHNTAISVHFIE